MNSPDPLLLNQLKALAHQNRLTIVGLLSDANYTVEELAVMLKLTPPTVSHHLSILSSADLVHASAQGYYNLYSLNTTTLQQLGDAFIQEGAFSQFTEGVDHSAYREAVIATFLDQPHVQRMLPGPPRKRAVILDHITHSIPTGQKHTLDDMNRKLSTFLPETGELLEELISTGRVTFHDNGYWTGHVDQTSGSGLGIWD